VFVLLLVAAVVMLALACACLIDHPAKAAELAVGAIASAPAIIVMWSFAAVLGLLVASVGVPQAAAVRGRASPEQLQRFLF